jgi:hypothetical protein
MKRQATIIIDGLHTLEVEWDCDHDCHAGENHALSGAADLLDELKERVLAYITNKDDAIDVRLKGEIQR